MSSLLFTCSGNENIPLWKLPPCPSSLKPKHLVMVFSPENKKCFLQQASRTTTILQQTQKNISSPIQSNFLCYNIKLSTPQKWQSVPWHRSVLHRASTEIAKQTAKLQAPCNSTAFGSSVADRLGNNRTWKLAFSLASKWKETACVYNKSSHQFDVSDEFCFVLA